MHIIPDVPQNPFKYRHVEKVIFACNFIDLWADSEMENDFNLYIIRMSKSHSAPLRLLAMSCIYLVIP